MASIVETAPLVLNVGVVLTAAATMGFAARKLGLPSVIGYLLTGLLVSPFTPGFVADLSGHQFFSGLAFQYLEPFYCPYQ